MPRYQTTTGDVSVQSPGLGGVTSLQLFDMNTSETRSRNSINKNNLEFHL